MTWRIGVAVLVVAAMVVVVLLAAGVWLHDVVLAGLGGGLAAAVAAELIMDRLR